MALNRWERLSGIPLYACLKLRTGEKIFVGAEDYLYFQRVLNEVAARYVISIHNFVLLPTQIHLLASQFLSTGSVHALILEACQLYQKNFYRRYGCHSDIARAEVKLIPVESNEYAIAASRYIDELPLKTGQTYYLGEYPWRASQELRERVERDYESRWSGSCHKAQQILAEHKEGPESEDIFGSDLFKYRMKLRSKLPIHPSNELL